MNILKYAVLVSSFMSGMLFFTACSDSDEPETKNDQRITLTESHKEMMERSYLFSINLFKTISSAKEFKDQSFIISPLAMQMNLSMLANGASGRTRQEILNLLQPGHGEETTVETLNELNRILIDEIPASNPDAKFALASSIWLSDGIEPSEAFREQLETYYHSALFSFDKQTEAGKTTINDWCSNATAGMIKNYFPVSPEDELYLLSALYLQSYWSLPFAESNTKNEDFNCENGNVVKVPMMYQEFNGPVYEDQSGIRVILNFGTGYSMQLIKPKKGYSIEEAFSNIKEATVSGRNIRLKLPRFSLETNAEFQDILSQMGAKNAFGTDSEYSFLSSSESISINHIRQYTKIEVNEKGKGAYSSSVSSESRSAGPPPETMEFYLDHPFGFLIMENSTCAVIAMGCINNL